MDEEKKDPELEEDKDYEEEPDFDEFDADAAPVEEPYHQISFPEEQPELFGDAASEEAKAAQHEILEDEGAGAYAAAQQKAEEDREVDEILEKRSAVNPVPKNDSWKTIHSEFAAEVEKFAHEAEDFAKKVNDYINDPEMEFARDEDEKDKIENQSSEKKDSLEYTDVEPEAVDIPSEKDTIIPNPEPKPSEPRRRTKRRKPEKSEEEELTAEQEAQAKRDAKAEKKAEKRRRKEERRRAKAAVDAERRRQYLDDQEAPVEDIKEEPVETPAAAADTAAAMEEIPDSEAEQLDEPKPVRPKLQFDRKKWRRKPEDPQINQAVVPAEFDIPLGTQEEWEAGEAEEPIIADRERPTLSFNDDPTRELSPVEELHLGDNNLKAEAEKKTEPAEPEDAEDAPDIDIPDVQSVDITHKKEEKPDGIAGDTGYLPDLSKIKEMSLVDVPDEDMAETDTGEMVAEAAEEAEAAEKVETAKTAEEPAGESDTAEPEEQIAAEKVRTAEVSQSPEDLDRTLEKFLVSDENSKREREDYEEDEVASEPADTDAESEEPEDSTESEEDEEPKRKNGFWSNLGHSIVNALEGGESDGEFSDDSLEDDTEDEPALADKTVALPTRNERIDHQFHEKTESDDETAAPAEDAEQDEISEAYDSFKTAVLKNVDEYLKEDESPEESEDKSTESEEPEESEPQDEAEPTDPSKEETLDLAEAAAQEKKKKNKKSKFVHTYELEKSPKIVPKGAHFNSLDKTILARDKDQLVVHEDPEQIDGQIKFEGFDEEEPKPTQLDDKHVEAVLRKKRTQQVKDFKIEKDDGATDVEDAEDADQTSSMDEMPSFGHGTKVNDFIDDEYHGPDDRRRINRELSSKTRNALISTIAQAVLTVAALVLGIFVALAHGNMEAIGGSTVTCGVIGMLLLLASAGFGWQVMWKGFAGIFKGKINAASGFAVVYTVSFVEDIVLMFVETSSQAASLYTAAACFGMTLTCWSRYLSLKRVMDNFKFMNSGTSLHSTRVITSKDDAKAIGRGLLVDEPTIAYHAPSEIPSGFIEDSLADDPADEYSKRPFFITIAVAAVVALIAGIINHSAATGVNVLACVMTLGIPAFSILTYNFGLYYEDKFLSRKNAVILGHRAVEKSAYIDTFAIDSSEIFGKGSCSILGIKTFHDMKIDDAILYAAALVIRSKGPLAEVFEKTILGKNNLLPEIEELQYEERLGLSAWSHDRRILFGNREFLINHNVQVPNPEYEAEYTRSGHKVCYLAISGKIAAMFVLRYRASRRVRKCLRQMDRAGITLLVSNTDCNVTEEMLSKKFRISQEAVKVISPVSSELLKKYEEGDENTESDDIGILHTGSPDASMRSLYEARRLYDGVSINNVFVLTYSAIAVILGIIFTFVTTAGMISDPFVLLTQFIGTLIAVGIAWSRSRHGVKEKKRK